MKMDELDKAAGTGSLSRTKSILSRIEGVNTKVQEQCLYAAMIAIDHGADQILSAILSCKAFQRKHKQKLINEIPNLLHRAACAKSLSPQKFEHVVDTITSSVTELATVADALKCLSDEGFSCLHLVSMDGDVEAARRLLELGADGKQRSRDGNTPLSFSIATNKKHFWEFIVSHSDVNSRDDDHDTPLMFAAWRKQHDLVSVLIRRGANVNARSRHGSTALWNAVYRGARHCMIILLQNNADMNVSCEGTHLFLSPENDDEEAEVKKIYPGHDRSLMWVAIDGTGSDKDGIRNLIMITTLIESGYDVTKEHWIRHLNTPYSRSMRQQYRRPVHDDDLPSNFAHNDALQKLIAFYYSRPLRLQDLCRNRLRKCHREIRPHLSYSRWVRKLELGTYLTDFLTLGYLQV